VARRPLSGIDCGGVKFLEPITSTKVCISAEPSRGPVVAVELGHSL
jgi:hypothetical protein